MKNKVLFKVGSVSVDTQTLLTVAGVVAGIVAIKKFSEKKGTPVVKIETEEEPAANYENYVDEDFFGYVDEDFMGLHGGDESMKFGGGRPISFANAGGTDNAIYEPNFYNSDGSVPIATDEPNFANSDGVYSVMQEDMAAVNPMAVQIAQRRGIFRGFKKKKAADLDGSIIFGSPRKLKKIKAKLHGGVMAIPPRRQKIRPKDIAGGVIEPPMPKLPPIKRGKPKSPRPVAMPPVAPMVIPRRRK